MIQNFQKLVLLVVAVGALVGSHTLGVSAQPYQVPPQDLRDGPGTRGGSLTLDLASEPRTFNPVLAQQESSRAITSLLHEPLFGDNGQPTLVAQFDRTVDNTGWTLFLREGLLFSDGKPFTCADVDFTFNRVLFNPDVASAKDVWRIEGQFPKVECVDDFTVKITTPALASVVFSQLLTYQVILPRHVLAETVANGDFNTTWGITTPPEKLVGLGPFRLKKYDPGQRALLERNPHYWKVDAEGTQLPYLDQVIMPIVRDDSVRVLRFLNSETELLRPRPEDRGPIVNKFGPGSVEVLQQARTTDSRGFVFNQDVQDPALRAVFRSVDFRQAMNRAADRDGMISLGFLGFADPRCGPGIALIFALGSQDVPCNGDTSKEELFNVDRAAGILDDLGLTDVDGDGTRNITDVFLNRPETQQALASLNVTLNDLPAEQDRELDFAILTVQGSKSMTTDAEIYAATLRSLDLNVRPNPVAESTLVAKLQSGEYQVGRFNFIGNGDPSIIADIFVSSGRQHFWKPSDAQGQDVPAWQQRVDQLFAMQKAGSGEERQAWMNEFQELAAKNVPMVFLYGVNDIFAFRKEQIGNFSGIAGQAILTHAEYLFRKDL